MKRVLLVCNVDVSLGLREVLKLAHPSLTVMESASFCEATEILESNSDIAFVFLSVHLPDCDGLVGLIRLRNDFPKIPVIVISPNVDRASIRNAMTLGAIAYIPESTPHEEMVHALREVLAGSSWAPLPADARADTVQARLMDTLSPAQRRIFKFLAQGLRNSEIASEMHVAEKTIKAYTTTMYRRLGVRNRTEALILAQDIFAVWDMPSGEPAHFDSEQP